MEVKQKKEACRREEVRAQISIRRINNKKIDNCTQMRKREVTLRKSDRYPRSYYVIFGFVCLIFRVFNQGQRKPYHFSRELSEGERRTENR